MAKGKKHEFSHTTVHHYKDGSGTTHHHHHSDPKKDVEYAHLDHDGMMDGMQQNLGAGPAEAEPQPGAEGGAPMAGGAAPGM